MVKKKKKLSAPTNNQVYRLPANHFSPWFRTTLPNKERTKCTTRSLPSFLPTPHSLLVMTGSKAFSNQFPWAG